MSDILTRDFDEPAQRRSVAQQVMTVIDLASTSQVKWAGMFGLANGYDLAQENPIAAKLSLIHI